jgi:hypothetical protein
MNLDNIQYLVVSAATVLFRGNFANTTIFSGGYFLRETLNR